jgi:NAD(P)-dependent dehydrogenase (short-subunit alcohol dehydrogenase family)
MQRASSVRPARFERKDARRQVATSPLIDREPSASRGSAIIGTTSEQAYDPSPDLYDYAQTKAATMNYVKSLAKQLGPKGIRVNGVVDSAPD